MLKANVSFYEATEKDLPRKTGEGTFKLRKLGVLLDHRFVEFEVSDTVDFSILKDTKIHDKIGVVLQFGLRGFNTVVSVKEIHTTPFTKDNIL